MPILHLPQNPNLEFLKGRAKLLHKRVRDNDPEAIEFIREHHPRFNGTSRNQHEVTEFSRTDAQLAIARGFGFQSWPKLKHHLDVIATYSRSPHLQPTGAAVHSPDELTNEFLRLACLTYGSDGRARWDQARELLGSHPELSAKNIYTAAATGDVTAAEAIVSNDPTLVSKTGGPFDWEPLCYLAFSRLDLSPPKYDTLKVARLLLAHGADPNAGYLWEGLPSAFTVLTGAFGEGEDAGNQPPHQYSLDLARLLLEAGADPNDSQTLYNRQFNPSNEHLSLLFQYGLGKGDGGPWRARLGHAYLSPAEMLHAQLTWAMKNNMIERAQLLLDHGVDPNFVGQRFGSSDRQPIWKQAVVRGSVEIAEILARAGARTVELSSAERFLAATMNNDKSAITTLAAAEPSIVPHAISLHPDAVLVAAKLRRPNVADLLVELGWDINYVHRMTALHEAASTGDLEMVKRLIALGADPTIVDRSFNSTPRGWAEYLKHPEVAAYLRNL